MLRAALCLALVTACSSKSEPPHPAPPAEAVESRAGHGNAAAGEGSAEPGGEPPSGTRADQEAPGRPPARGPARVSRPIDIILRSSPPGATAAVDGVPIGATPTYWAGDANGREHEFTFVLPGYAFARYRFVPITSGVVHARLEVIADDTDAGVPAEMIHVYPDASAPADAPRPRVHAPPAQNPASPAQNPASPAQNPAAPNAASPASEAEVAPTDRAPVPPETAPAPSEPAPTATTAPAAPAAPPAP